MNIEAELQGWMEDEIKVLKKTTKEVMQDVYEKKYPGKEIPKRIKICNMSRDERKKMWERIAVAMGTGRSWNVCKTKYAMLKLQKRQQNIALCFCVRNCGKYLRRIFKNIELLKTLNFNIFCIFVYDNCLDNSEKLLKKYKKKNNDSVFIRKIINNSPMRTVRIAKARNVCLDIVYNELRNITFHIMIDSDNIGAPPWNIDIINKYLNNFDGDNWDCISFNKNCYYDIWGLLYNDIYQHCWGFREKTPDVIRVMASDITNKLQNSKSNIIEVISAFNGFCIYKTERFKGFHYDGLYDNFATLVTDIERNKTVEALKKLNVNVDHIEFCGDRGECCEHLFYHLSAFKKGLKIKISKFIIN